MSGRVMKNNAIAYQNKDIATKLFGEQLRDKSFAVYGLELPKIVDVLPTNLPSIEANELRIDNLFLLEDGSLALVDYESTYTDLSKIKYLNYIIRTLKRNMNSDQLSRKIRMIVIYTADIHPGETRRWLDVGCLKFELEEAFLMDLDAQQIEASLADKIKSGEKLTEEDQMKFMILPLAFCGKQKKRECIRRCFDMAKVIRDDKMQKFLLAGLLVFADKVITQQDSKQIKEWIMMTKVAQLFEEEKIQYGKDEIRKKEFEFARKLLSRGDTVESVAEIMDIITVADIEKLAEEI